MSQKNNVIKVCVQSVRVTLKRSEKRGVRQRVGETRRDAERGRERGGDRQREVETGGARW